MFLGVCAWRGHIKENPDRENMFRMPDQLLQGGGRVIPTGLIGSEQRFCRLGQSDQRVEAFLTLGVDRRQISAMLAVR